MERDFSHALGLAEIQPGNGAPLTKSLEASSLFVRVL